MTSEQQVPMVSRGIILGLPLALITCAGHPVQAPAVGPRSEIKCFRMALDPTSGFPTHIVLVAVEAPRQGYYLWLPSAQLARPGQGDTLVPPRPMGWWLIQPDTILVIQTDTTVEHFRGHRFSVAMRAHIVGDSLYGGLVPRLELLDGVVVMPVRGAKEQCPL